MIRDWLIDWALRRAPDFVIGGSERPYLRRWWLLPRNPLFNVYVHQFLRSDDDRALHDHPWAFNASWLLRGEYIEHTVEAGGINVRTHRQAGAFKFRWGPAPHRVELLEEPAPQHPDHWICGHPNCEQCRIPMGTCSPCWTLFITGPRVRHWGFHCPDQGWIHWKRFTAPHDKGDIGKGCEA